MDRREYVTTALTPLVIGVSGCIGSLRDTPRGIAVQTLHTVGSYLEETEVEAGSEVLSEQYTITDHETARALLAVQEHPEIADLITRTDFTRSYLVVVVAVGWSSHEWLEVDEIERIEEGIRLAIKSEYHEDEIPPDDVATHSLVVRITDEAASIPERVLIEIDGEEQGTAHVTSE